MKVATIAVQRWQVDEEKFFGTADEIHRLLGIRSSKTRAKVSRTLGWARKSRFTVQDAIDAFMLKEYVRANLGDKSINYRVFQMGMKHPAYLRLMFQQVGIDIDLKVKKFRETL